MGLAAPALTDSRVSLGSNAVKSLIFACAGLLAVLAVQYFFAWHASRRGGAFTAYVMFSEGYRQRALFVRSRGLCSRAGKLVFWFTIMCFLAGFYATFLWALDSPGYVLRGLNASLATFNHPFVDVPDHIITLSLSPDTLGSLEGEFSRRFTANLFDSQNLTLVEASRGEPQVVKSTQPGVGARIWLDDEGLSVSPDTSVMLMTKPAEDGTLIKLRDCVLKPLANSLGWGWNCTFDNTFAQSQLGESTTRPEVHWDDVSDRASDTRYIRPNRMDNIWASYGVGIGTAAMEQVFTVTKTNRRHTFLQTALRVTMWTPPTSLFATSEIDDLLRRSWSTNETERQMPLLAGVSRSIRLAQARNQSFTGGLSAADNVTASQVTWEYLTAESNRIPIYSTIRFSVSTITLIRSETLPPSRVPVPFNNEACPVRFMNIAYGGRVTGTDCRLAETNEDWARLRNLSTTPQFFGQVDTSAVLILTGLGNGQSNRSAEALDETVLQWLYSPAVSGRIDSLFLARGFAVGVGPALVTVTETRAIPAASLLQFVLVGFVALLAFVAWLISSCFTEARWQHTMFWNLVYSLMGEELPRGSWLWRKLVGGDLENVPEAAFRGREMAVAGTPLGWSGSSDGSPTAPMSDTNLALPVVDHRQPGLT